jgi:hypothetical protein
MTDLPYASSKAGAGREKEIRACLLAILRALQAEGRG